MLATGWPCPKYSQYTLFPFLLAYGFKFGVRTNTFSTSSTLISKAHILSDSENVVFLLETRSYAALWAADLRSSGQDTFQTGTFGGFPTSHFAPPAL